MNLNRRLMDYSGPVTVATKTCISIVGPFPILPHSFGSLCRSIQRPSAAGFPSEKILQRIVARGAYDAFWRVANERQTVWRPQEFDAKEVYIRHITERCQHLLGRQIRPHFRVSASKIINANCTFLS